MEEDEKKNAGDLLKEALSLGAPAYPTKGEPKQEEKQQMSQPQDEFRDTEPTKSEPK